MAVAIFDYEALAEPGEEDNLEFEEGDLIQVHTNQVVSMVQLGGRVHKGESRAPSLTIILFHYSHFFYTYSSSPFYLLFPLVGYTCIYRILSINE